MDYNELKKTVEAFADIKERLNDLINDCLANVKSYSVDGSSEWEKEIAEAYQRKAAIYAELSLHLDKLFKTKI